MKNAQTATPNMDVLVDYIKRLTPAQYDKLAKSIPLLKQLAGMTDSERIFAETFLADVCGKVEA